MGREKFLFDMAIGVPGGGAVNSFTVVLMTRPCHVVCIHVGREASRIILTNSNASKEVSVPQQGSSMFPLFIS